VFVVFRESAARSDAAITLARNGNPVASVAQRAPKITVQKATYGAPGDPQRTRDVRREVQRKVDAGETSFPVPDMALGGDPAPGVIKTFAIDYTIDGKHFTVKGTDRDIVHVSGDAVKIVVEKAVYGVLTDPKRTRDVRAKLQRLADAGESSFVVARMAEGDDPAYGIVKTLVAEYRIDGKRVTATGTDPETILLASTEGSPRVAEVRRGADGGLCIEAWQPGRYEVRLASGARRTVNVASVPSPQEIAGPWDVFFPSDTAAPQMLKFERLVSWSQRPKRSVKYFSGTATCRTTFTVPGDMLARGRRLYLDLGRVQAIAQVALNGNQLGVLWKPPFCLEVSKFIAAGENRLEVQVTNLWPNRLIGDEQLPEDSRRNPDGTLKAWPQWLLEGKPSPTGRQTFTTWRLWKKNDALLESGLLGPVRLVAAEQVSVSR